MRLICPHCMSGVTVPDDTAGKEAVCPNCGKSFPTPSRYSATVVPDTSTPIAGAIEPVRTSPHPEPPTPPAAMPAPPPGYVPPAPPSQLAASGFLAPSAPVSSEVLTPAGYTRSLGVTLSPHVIAWLPAILLTLVLVLTFFPWVGIYAGGSGVFWQQPWRALIGDVGRNLPLENAVKIPASWLNIVKGDWELMIPYLLFLLLAVVLAWVDRLLPTLDIRRIPPLVKLWPYRRELIAALALITFPLSLIQVLNGFGMERAIRKTVNDQFAEAREKAANDKATLPRIDYEAEVTYRSYNLERTSWMYLALLCNLLAVLAILTSLLLERRGNKPPPKLILHY